MLGPWEASLWTVSTGCAWWYAARLNPRKYPPAWPGTAPWLEVLAYSPLTEVL